MRLEQQRCFCWIAMTHLGKNCDWKILVFMESKKYGIGYMWIYD